MNAAVRRGEALGEGARLVVVVPVEGLREDQALRVVQPQPVDVGKEHQQPGEVLPALHDAELGRLLDRVGGVAAGVRQADDPGLGGLRLQQERGEVLGVQRVAHLAEDLAAGLQHHRLGIALERVAEGVIGGEEEPGVVGPVNRVWRAGLAGQVGARRARDDQRLALVAGNLVHGQRHARVRHVEDDVHLVDVVPLAGDGRADIGLVLVIGREDLDLHALFRGTEILDRHARGDHRALPREVGVEARLVVQHADPDHAVGHLGVSRAGGESHRCCCRHLA